VIEARTHGAALADAALTEVPAQPCALAEVHEQPTICILALSAIADDPRVRRQGEAFHRTGWNVIAVGLPGARSSQPQWSILTRESLPAVFDMSVPTASATNIPSGSSTPNSLSVPLRLHIKLWLRRQFQDTSWLLSGLPPHQRSVLKRAVRLILRLLQSVIRMVRRVRRILAYPVRIAHDGVIRSYYRSRQRLNGRIRYALRLLCVRVRPSLAQEIYWSFSENIQHIYSVAREQTAAVWLANDWTMLPLAARLARERGGVYGYDTHEFAAEEYGDQRKWRLWHRPMVCALEREFIRDAATVSAVSRAIADRLQRLYPLPNPSIVIRNTPSFEAFAFRPTARDRVKVLYHGIVTPGRGLEATIDSVVAWRPMFELTIRGPGDEGYLNDLRCRIVERGIVGRVVIAPPVPMTALVREATVYDIGFFALPGSSRHNEFALPNKFFEYVMAGLALCVTDLPEMASLLHEHDLGVTFPHVDPDAIAAAVNGLDPSSIDRYKRNALTAARELCWERESGRLVAAYGAVIGRPRPQAA
jgi:glycosyltransferase involved in cell wall biosynthesis